MSEKESFIERLVKFKEAKGLSNAKISKALGIEPRTFNYYFEGRRTPAFVLERVLLAYPELSAEWLLRGEGEMFIDGSEKASLDDLLEKNRTLQENNTALRLAIEALSAKKNG